MPATMARDTREKDTATRGELFTHVRTVASRAWLNVPPGRVVPRRERPNTTGSTAPTAPLVPTTRPAWSRSRTGPETGPDATRDDADPAPHVRLVGTPTGRRQSYGDRRPTPEARPRRGAGDGSGFGIVKLVILAVAGLHDRGALLGVVEGRQDRRDADRRPTGRPARHHLSDRRLRLARRPHPGGAQGARHRRRRRPAHRHDHAAPHRRRAQHVDVDPARLDRRHPRSRHHQDQRRLRLRRPQAADRRPIENKTGIRIDDYVEIGFGGFVGMVDARRRRGDLPQGRR